MKVNKTVQATVTVANVQRKETIQVVDPSKLISRLSEHSTAMEVKPHIWRGTTTDDSLKEVLVQHCQGSSEAFNNPTLKIMPPDIRQTVTSKVTEATNFFKRYSIPFGSGRIRLVPNSLFAQVRMELDKLNVELKHLGEDVANKRADIVEWAKDKLGTAYKEDVVPSTETLKTKCYLEVTLSAVSLPPVITGVDNAGELRNQIAKDMAEQFARGFNEVVRGVVQQFKEAKEALAKEDQKGIRYESLVKGFISQITRMKQLNIGQDEQVEAAIKKAIEQVQKLADMKGKLKGDKKAREEMANAMTSAEEVLGEIRIG